jgi:hypothetical protein
VSGIARCRFSGLPSTGDDALSAESGSGSTPRNGAESMATDAAASPRPATIIVSRPPKECPITAGFFSSLLITSE